MFKNKVAVFIVLGLILAAGVGVRLPIILNKTVNLKWQKRFWLNINLPPWIKLL